MRYLITGGAGFIGSHLVDALTTRGDDVLVLDDLSTGRLENLDEVDESGRGGSPTPTRDVLRQADVPRRLGGPRSRAPSPTRRSSTIACHRSTSASTSRRQSESSWSSSSRSQSLLRNVRGCDIVICGGGAPRPAAPVHLHLGDLRKEQRRIAVGRLRPDPRVAVPVALELRDGQVVRREPRSRLPPQSSTPRRSSPGSSTPSARGRREPTGWCCRDSSVRRGSTTTSPSTARARSRAASPTCSTRSMRWSCCCDSDEAIGNVYNVGSARPVLDHRARRQGDRADGLGVEDQARALRRGIRSRASRSSAAGYPDTTALRELTGWQPSRTIDEMIDDVIAYEQRGTKARRAPTRAGGPRSSCGWLGDGDRGLTADAAAFIASYVVALAATPLAIRVAARTGFLDRPRGLQGALQGDAVPGRRRGALAGFLAGALAYGDGRGLPPDPDLRRGRRSSGSSGRSTIVSRSARGSGCLPGGGRRFVLLARRSRLDAVRERSRRPRRDRPVGRRDRQRVQPDGQPRWRRGTVAARLRRRDRVPDASSRDPKRSPRSAWRSAAPVSDSSTST